MASGIRLPPVERPEVGVAAPEERWARVGLAAAVALMVVALIVAPLFGWDVNRGGGAPLANVGWLPRIGPGTGPAVLLGAAAIRWACALFERLRWRQALGLAYVASLG